MMNDYEEFFEEDEEQIVEKQPFFIDTFNKAEWLIEKLHDIDNEIKQLEKKEEVLKAQIEKNKKRKLNKRRFLEYKYGRMLEEWARKELEGKKERSIIFPYGTISFRKTEIGWKIENLQEAKKFAKEHNLEVFSKKEVQEFDLDAYKKIAESEFHRNDFVLPGLRYNNSEENFNINTG